jgi:Domain of unknown function (DUF4426)
MLPPLRQRSTTRSVAHLALVTIIVFVGTVITGCSEQPDTMPTPAQPSEESFIQNGDYQLHYSAVITASIAPEIAQSYGIERSKHRALLNISVLHKDAQKARFEPVSADLSVETNNLIGQPKSIAMRAVNVGDTVSYIGELSISNRETLIFNIKATPSQSTQSLTAKFKHEFFVD